MEQLAAWREFNVAMSGATAALAGLVIVAASVNIAKIIAATTLTARMAAAIATLVLALVVSAIGLMPDISSSWYGGVMLTLALLTGLFQFHATLVIASDPEQRPLARVAKPVLGILPVVAYAVAGAALLVEEPFGLVLAGIGCLLAIVSALVISWIALVEVLR